MVDFEAFDALRICVTVSVHFVNWIDPVNHSAHWFLAQVQAVASVAIGAKIVLHAMALLKHCAELNHLPRQEGVRAAIPHVQILNS